GLPARQWLGDGRGEEAVSLLCSLSFLLLKSPLRKNPPANGVIGRNSAQTIANWRKKSALFANFNPESLNPEPEKLSPVKPSKGQQSLLKVSPKKSLRPSSALPDGFGRVRSLPDSQLFTE